MISLHSFVFGIHQTLCPHSSVDIDYIQQTQKHTGNDRGHPEKFTLHRSSHKLEWTLGKISHQQEIKYHSIGWNMRGTGRGRCLRKHGF